MFLEMVNAVALEFIKIDSRSEGEKSPSGPIKTHKDLVFFKSSDFKK